MIKTLKNWHKEPRLTILLVGLVSAMLVIGATEIIADLAQQNQLERVRSQTLSKLSTLRARLEGEMHSTLHLTRGLTAYVAIHPEVDSDEFTKLASEITFIGRNIRNIGLARNNKITHMFPLAGNEAALGLDYEKNEKQWPAVKKAIDLKGTVVAGPVELIQGGTAFVARTPIYTRPGVSGILDKHKPQYWGITSIVIDMPRFFHSSGIHQNSNEIEFAIRGADSLGAEGDMIIGHKKIFEPHNEAVNQPVLLPNGSWQIAAIPKGGWQEAIDPLWLPRLSGWLIGVFIGILIGALARAREINRSLALHDHLTGLPNRRLLEDRLEQMIATSNRDQLSFAILYIDLDDFKQVNDQYGHKTGDGLLIEITHRMKSSVRNTDTVARIGGDEFIILISNAESRTEVQRVISLLKHNLSGTTMIEGHQVALQASIGVTFFPVDGLNLDELLKSADRQMYAEKSRSRLQLVD